MAKGLKALGLTMLRELIILGLIATITVWSLGLFNDSKNKYTDEEHLQRVAERIEKEYIEKGEIVGSSKVTDFEVYPVYEQVGRIKYVLVEFQPTGYIFVNINESNHKGFLGIGRRSMYLRSSIYGETAWSPYTIDSENKLNELWEVDENGNKIEYLSSPYSVRGINDEKLYLINIIDSRFIPSIKKGEKYLNLVSNNEFEIINENIQKKQPSLEIVFIDDKSYDL